MSFLEIWLSLLCVAMLVPLVGSAAISAVIRHANQIIVNRFGTKAQTYFSFCGIVVHELSHAMLAIIFGHKIDKIHLIQLADQDNRLGYVSHAWNPKNWYQQLGNFFIGMAPIIGIGVAMLGVLKVVWPQLFAALIAQNAKLLWEGVVWWQFLCGLIVVIQLCLALNLSAADWQNIRSGMWSYGVMLSLLAIPLYFWLGSARDLWFNFGCYIAAYLLFVFSLSSLLSVLLHLLFSPKE